MTRVLLIGIAPDAVDFTDPDLPPGLTQETIDAGIKATLADMQSRGWEAEFCALRTDDSAEEAMAQRLSNRWDCIVIGGGIRIPSRGLPFFERVINSIRRVAPNTPIAFNTSPRDSADAAARWIGRS